MSTQVERWSTPKKRCPRLRGAAGRRKTVEMDGERDVGKDTENNERWRGWHYENMKRLEVGGMKIVYLDLPNMLDAKDMEI